MTTMNRTRPTGAGRRSAGTPRMRRSRRGCVCQDGEIDYKDVSAMRRFVNERGKIGSPRRTGASAKCQRELATAVKRARHLALIPFAPQHRHMTDTVQESSHQREVAAPSEQTAEVPHGVPTAIPSVSDSPDSASSEDESSASENVGSAASEGETGDVAQTDA